MGALKQYIELYREGRELLCSRSCQVMNGRRDDALQSLEVNGLPKKGSENYEITDLDEMLAPDYGINLGRIPLDVNVKESFRCGVPHVTTSLFFMLNDLYGESAEARIGLPAGVEIGPLHAALDVEENAKLYGALADIANPIVALDTLFVQGGVCLRVRKGVKVEKPVQLVNILDATIPMMAVRRLLIIVEEGAEISFLSCDHSSASHNPLAALSVAEVYVGKHAKFGFYDMEESGSNTSRLSALYLTQEEGSDVTLACFTLHNGRSRNEFHSVFAGKQAGLRLLGFGVESGSSLVDNFTHIRHEVGECVTDELFKYVLDDESRGAFTGKIYVAPGAAKTEAYQSNRSILGSGKARVFSKPQLITCNDDVKCSHGSATGQLDPMEVFYMRSRGIEEAEARLLLKQAFMADVIDGVGLSILRDRLRLLVERRFSGEDVSCSNCNVCNDQENEES